jgi:hypothetical protein
MLESEDVRTLTDLGFLAISRGLHAHAGAIFEGVKAARPAQEAGFIGSALVHLSRGEIEPAIAVLKALPPTEAARVFLGIALARHGDNAQAREVLQDVLQHAPETPYGALARVTLEQLAK